MRFDEIPNNLDIDTKVLAFLAGLTPRDIDILQMLILEKDRMEQNE